MSLLIIFNRQVRREVLLRVRDLRSSCNAVLFFLMIIIVLPLTIPANSPALTVLSPGIIWIAVVFAVFLSVERLFSQDYDDGVIEQWLVSSVPITVIVLAKLFVHWFVIVSALLLLSPFVATLLKLDWYTIFIVDLSVIFATPTIVCLCGLAESLAAGLKQKTLLMALIVIPLNIPILILCSEVTRLAMAQEPVLGVLALVLAISLISIISLPFSISGVIRFCLAD